MTEKILFHIIFIIVSVLFLEFNGYINQDKSHYDIENSTEMDHTENSFISDTDSSEEDQIIQNSHTDSTEEQKGYIPNPKNYFLIQKYPSSAWQPPKSC